MIIPPLRRALFVAISATALALPAAGAQAAGPRWHPWLGCWSATPADTSRFLNAPPARIVCVAPTSDADVVEVSSIADGKLLTSDRIDASGRTQAVDMNGCTGSESARWSADQRRVFLKSSVTCQGVGSEMSAVLSINAAGDWLDVRRTRAGGDPIVRVARYRDVGLPEGVPADMAKTLAEWRMATLAGRAAAGAPIGSAAIIEASHIVDAAILEEWVRATGQRFATDSRTMSELADAGVSSRVTDAMVAVSNRTALADAGTGGGDSYHRGRSNCGLYGCFGRGAEEYWDQGTGQRVFVTVTTYDPWGFGYWPFGRRYFDRGFLGYAPYGYGPYGYNPYMGGSGWGYGYGDSYRGGSVTGYTYPPTIVLHQDPGGTESWGRAERGKADAPGEAAPGTAAAAAPRTAAPRPSAPPPAPVQAQAPASSKGSDDKGSSGRTAKAKPGFR